MPGFLDEPFNSTRKNRYEINSQYPSRLDHRGLNRAGSDVTIGCFNGESITVEHFCLLNVDLNNNDDDLLARNVRGAH